MNQSEVDRKRKIAEALMGMQAPSPQMVGRFYVGPSTGAQIASGVGNVAGSYMDKKADEGQTGIDDQKKAELARHLQGLTGAEGGNPKMAAALAAIQGLPIEQQQAAVSQLAARNLTPQGPIKLGANDRLIDPNTMQPMVDAAPKPEKLMAVIGEDGKPTYVPQSQAAGQTPYRSGGVTVNTGSEYGTIPQGYRLVKDEQGGVRMEVIPGGPAEAEAQADAAAQANKGALESRKNDLLLQEIDRSFAMLESESLPETGAAGVLLRNVPGTDAHALANTLKTIRSNIGFDRLQQMRDSSPSGGALGQVSERELSELQAVLGSLEQSQRKEDLSFNLARLNNLYLDIVHGPNGGPERMELPSYREQQPQNLPQPGIGQQEQPVRPALPAAGQQADPVQMAEGLQPGVVMDGYVYLGGDPADPNSWKQQ